MTATIVRKPEWIEKLPNGWAFLPVRAVLKERKEKNTKLEESNILSVMKGIGVIRYEDKGNIGNKSSERPEAYKIVRANDLVLNSMNLSIGSVGMAREDGVTSSVYIIYQARPKVANPDFYHYLFQTTSFQKHLASYGRGIMELREAVKERDIKNQPVVVPPLETQKRIADFLDEKTRIIDELVEKKEQLIELLREKRASLITRAVTNGLDPNPKLKPSSIDWLGDIPAGWRLKKLKFCLGLVNKKGIGTSNNKVALENIESWTGRYIETDSNYEGGTEFREGDVLFGKLRPYLAKVFLATDSGEAIGDILVYRTKKEVMPRFAFYFFLSDGFIDVVNSSTFGAKMPRAESFFVGNLSFVLAGVNEQKQIVDFLDTETAKIDKAVALIGSQIEKLKEYRSSLIYHAVTGKIRV